MTGAATALRCRGMGDAQGHFISGQMAVIDLVASEASLVLEREMAGIAVLVPGTAPASPVVSRRGLTVAAVTVIGAVAGLA